MSLITSSPVDIEEIIYDPNSIFKEPKYTQWAIDSIVEHFNDILTTIAIIKDINDKHHLNEVYQMKKLNLSENPTNHKQLLAYYHNKIVDKFNKTKSFVLKEQLITNYIEYIKNNINKGRGIRRTLKKNKRKRKRTGKRV
jgi:hypothetical protein